ncbi:hypothetical protein Glove_87g84 [Diversispora epigaea]|uniref:Protein kinase domain-containing protein n=1 Tax=Diversispora epigaea TaxID=1348612 RepID=A0A397JF80_9GLOM|nr:hypothetical protein Glove_87g84 [Diversispora epigaea]
MSSKNDLFESALYIKKFDYNTFRNITEIASGVFGTVHRAYSTNLERYVALKSLHENDELFYEKFVRELTNIMVVNYHDNIINFYGISKDPSTETLNWKVKINMAKDITSGLHRIHKENIVHKDLHSKNILVHEGRLLITDLVSSQSLNSISVERGMIAYTDPEYLRNPFNYKRSKASDIYSLGVLFWEISSGRPPFNNIPNLEINRKVTSSEREKPINETPKDYINIYSSAWNNDPNQRPTIENIFDSLESIKLENIYNDSNDQDIQLEAHISNQSPVSSSRDSMSIASSLATSNWAMKTLQALSTSLTTFISTTLNLNYYDNVKKDQIIKYNYNDFKNLKNIGKGIYSATLMNGKRTVALKSIVVATTELFDNELKQYSHASLHENIIGFYGISQKNLKSNEYTLVLEYANGGTLRDHLKSNFEKLEWSDKLNLAKQIVKAIEHLHSNGIIHGDLHSTNILLHDNIIKISDFGIARLSTESSIDSKNSLVSIEYSDPIFLKRLGKYSKTKASDIYSIGILLWEISSGKIPYESKFQDEFDLIIYVLRGNREDPIVGTPQDYINIYQDCWSQDPNQRPNIEKVILDFEYANFKKKFFESIKSNTPKIPSIEPFVPLTDVRLLDKIRSICGNTNTDRIDILKINSDLSEQLIFNIMTKLQSHYIPPLTSEHLLNLLDSGQFWKLIFRAEGHVENLHKHPHVQQIRDDFNQLASLIFEKTIDIKSLQLILRYTDTELFTYFDCPNLKKKLNTVFVSKTDISDVRKQCKNYGSTLNKLRIYYEIFCPAENVSDVQEYLLKIDTESKMLSQIRLKDVISPEHWEFHSETIEMARKVYGFAESQTFGNIFNSLLSEVAEMLTVEDITKTILTKALERFAQLCKQYKGQDWEKLKCSDAASLWKDVTNVELELKLMENYVALSKNKKNYDNLVKTLKRLVSVPFWVVRLEQLSTIIEIFDVPHEKDWLIKSRHILQDDILTLGKLNNFFDYLNGNLSKIDSDTCWSLIKELSEAGDFLEFLKRISKHDIKNLINGVDDFNDERLIQEDAVASLIQVQQLLLQLMNKVKSKDISIKKFLADLAAINSDNPTLVGKITLCLSCNMALQNMYKNISNRGEVTKEKIQNAIKKGTYSFERIGKDEKFTVALTYPSKGSNVKPYTLSDLQDLRGRALLIAKPTSAVSMRMDVNEEEQIAKAQIMDEFVRQVDFVHEICNVGVKLIQMGHFGYRQYEKSISGDNKMKGLTELLETLEEDLNQWENIVDRAQETHYYLTFFPARHILTFLDYFTNDDQANREICKTLIRFVNEKARLIPIKKGGFKISSCNYLEILCEIGAKIKNIFGDIPIQLRPLKTKGVVVLSDIVHRGRLFVAACIDKLLVPNIIMSIYTNHGHFPEPWQILICKSSTTMEELSIFTKRCFFAADNGYKDHLFCIANLEVLDFDLQYNLVNFIRSLRVVVLSDIVHRGRLFVAACIDKLLVPNIIMSIYTNHGHFPEPWQILICKSSTTMEELSIFTKRCFFAADNGYKDHLFCIANLEVLDFDLQYNLVNFIRSLREKHADYLLALICCREAGLHHHILDQFSADVVNTNGLCSETMKNIYSQLCPNVVCVFSDLSGQGKSEWIKQSSYLKRKIPRSFLISDGINFSKLVHQLKKSQLREKESLHINIVSTNNSSDVNMFLFELLTLGFVFSDMDIAYLPQTTVFIEIASPTNKNYLIHFQSQVILQKLIFSNEIHSPIQIVCHYLNAFDQAKIDENNLLFSGEGAITQLLPAKRCQDLVAKYFFDENADNNSSYRFVEIFINVLADQLVRFSSSSYFRIENLKQIAKEECLNLRTTLLRKLIDVSKDFATRSIQTKVAQLESIGNIDADLEDIKIDIKSWDESNHLLVCFMSQSPDSICTLYRDPKKVDENVKAFLRSQFVGNLREWKLEDYNSLSDTELLNRLECFARKTTKKIDLPGYVLSADNLVKMALILLRARANIPVVVMGEAGCGKTSLISYLANVVEVKFKALNLHAGISEANILNFMSEVEKDAVNGEIWIFFDEINTGDHIGLLADLIAHQMLLGKSIHPNIRLFSACNPYRIRTKSQSQAGLKAKVKVNRYEEQSKLVYQVKPLPDQILDYTSLISYLANVVEVKFKALNLHAGISEANILNFMSEVEKDAVNGEIWIFFDEINTGDHIGLLADLIAHQMLLGKSIHPNIRLFSACNPYRIRTKSQSQAGLKAKVKVNRYEEQSKLVYQVKPLPDQILDYVWDYGILQKNDEKKYIQIMTHKELKELNHPVLTELLFGSQEFIRSIEEKYSVSLRDVKRAIKLIKFFNYSLNNRPRRSKNRPKYPNENSIPLPFRCYILALTLCYQSRIYDQEERMNYRKDMVKIFRSKNINLDHKKFKEIIKQEQDDIVKRMNIPPNIALNEALLENVLVMTVCILTKIPVFIIGAPGSSKSLAIRLISQNLRGKDSNDRFFRTLPQVYLIPHQGSSSSTSDGIIEVFQKANKFQKTSSDEFPSISVVLLDEVGLAETSPHNPLKVLHSLLEPSYPADGPTVSVVGISNWRLDNSKSSRALLVQRPKFGIEDLVETAGRLLEGKARSVSLKPLAEAYSEYEQSGQIHPNFHGLRDYYGLIKSLSTAEMTPENIQMALARNFGGTDQNIRLCEEYFGDVLQKFNNYGEWKYEPISTSELINANLRDESARHLMVIGKSDSIVNILDFQLKSQELEPVVILGSQFPDDQQDYSYSVLSRIMMCVEAGRPLILTDLDIIYGALYDLWNQNYIVYGNKDNPRYFTRVALGAYANPMLYVDNKFRCILVLDESRLDKADPPLLHRFEKQRLTIEDVLTRQQHEIVEILKDWVRQMGTLVSKNRISSRSDFTLKDLFISFDPDETLQSLVMYTMKMNPESQHEEILKKCKESLVAIASADGIVRATKSAIDPEEILDESRLDKADPPLLHRFEKQRLTIEDVLTRQQHEIVEILKDWVRQMGTLVSKNRISSRSDFTLKDLFISFDPDETLQSLVMYTMKMNPESQHEEILKKCKESLVAIASADGIVRATKSAIDPEESLLWKNIYFSSQENNNQHHDHLEDYFVSLLYELGLDPESSLVIVNTFSNINTDVKECLEKVSRVQVDKLSTFKTEAQLQNRVKHFWLESNNQMLVLQCDMTTKNSGCIKLAKFIIEQYRNEFLQIKTTKMLAKHACIILHRKQETKFLSFNFMCGWRQVTIETLAPQEKSLSSLLDGSLISIMKTTYPFEEILKQELLWCLLCMKYPSTENSINRIKMISSEIFKHPSFIECLKERTLMWIDEKSSTDWQYQVASDKRLLYSYSSFSAALQAYIRSLVRGPIAKILYSLEKLSAINTFFEIDTPENRKDSLTTFWKDMFNDPKVMATEDLVDPNPDVYTLPQIYDLNFPFSGYFIKRIDDFKEMYLEEIARLKQERENCDEFGELQPFIEDTTYRVFKSNILSSILHLRDAPLEEFSELYFNDFVTVISSTDGSKKDIKLLSLILKQLLDEDKIKDPVYLHVYWWTNSSAIFANFQLAHLCPTIVSDFSEKRANLSFKDFLIKEVTIMMLNKLNGNKVENINVHQIDQWHRQATKIITYTRKLIRSRKLPIFHLLRICNEFVASKSICLKDIKEIIRLGLTSDEILSKEFINYVLEVLDQLEVNEKILILMRSFITRCLDVISIESQVILHLYQNIFSREPFSLIGPIISRIFAKEDDENIFFGIFENAHMILQRSPRMNVINTALKAKDLNSPMAALCCDIIQQNYFSVLDMDDMVEYFLSASNALLNAGIEPLQLISSIAFLKEFVGKLWDTTITDDFTQPIAIDKIMEIGNFNVQAVLDQINNVMAIENPLIYSLKIYFLRDLRFREFSIDDVKKFCKGQARTLPWLLSLKWGDNNDNRLPFNTYWYLPEYAQAEDAFRFLYSINNNSQMQQFMQLLPNNLNSRIAFAGLIISRLHIIRASREWGPNEIRTADFLKNVSKVNGLSDIYKNSINKIILNRHPLLHFDARMDNNTLFINSVIAHTIILHASMNPNVSPLTTLLHRLDLCQNMYILTCISDMEPYVLTAVLRAEQVTRYTCSCGYKYVIANCVYDVIEQKCPECKTRTLGGANHVDHASNTRVDANPLTRPLAPNDIAGYIGEALNPDIGYCVRSMPPTSFRVLHLFVHILIGASAPLTIAINFLQKNNQVATDTEHYCLGHIQNDWNVLKQILNCSDENLALTLHSILANMTQNPPSASNLNAPNQREEWETLFTRNYVSSQIKSITETTTNFRTRLDTASNAVQGNNANVIESEINQTLTTVDISQLPRLWRKIGINTFESFRAYYNGNLAQYKEQFPVLAVYFIHEERLTHVKHLWDIVKFVQLLSARLSYRLNRKEVSALTFREYFSSERNDEALMTAYRDFEKAWNSVIDNVDRYQCQKININPKMNFDQKLILALIEPKDEGVFLCAILEYLVFIQNKFIEEIMTIKPGTCRSLRFLEDFDSFDETEGPPQYYIQSLTLEQSRKDNLILYQWEDDYDGILQFSERDLGLGRGQDIIYDLQKIEQELARYLVFEKVHIETIENTTLFMETFSYHMELFQSSMTIIGDIRNLIPQEPISPEKAAAIMGIPTNSFNFSPDQMDTPIDNPSDILKALEILLCFVKRSPGGSGEFFIKDYVAQWVSLSEISENAKFNNLLNLDLKLKHLVGLYELIEEKVANITVKYVSEKYQAPISNNLVDSLNKVIDWTIPPSQQELLPADIFALALKRFMYRCLQGETIEENVPLNIYICDKSLYFWPSTVSQELINDLFSDKIMVSHTFTVYEFITKQLEKLIRRQHQQRQLPQEPQKRQQERRQERPQHVASTRKNKNVIFDEPLEIFKKNKAETNVANDNNFFNSIQFTKPQITINNRPNILNDSYLENFFSVEANVYLGTSSSSHTQVEKLITLISNKKNEIDKILESQSAYIIEPDFREGSSVPHISCWVNEPLDISILEKLEKLFDDEFEVIDCLVNKEIEEENDNGDNNNKENSEKQQTGNGRKENDNERNDKKGKRTSKKKQNNNKKKKSNKNNNSDNDSDDSYHSDDNELSETNGHILISSEIIAKVKDTDIIQDFKISAFLWANVYPDTTNETHNLKFSININDCRMGKMLSDRWPSLRKLGNGYFLDSVEIWVIPIQNEFIPNKPLYTVKNGPWPQQSNKDVNFLELFESIKSAGASINKDPGINIGFDKKYQHGLNYTAKEWKLNVDGGGSETGLGWVYCYLADKVSKNFNDRRNFAPGNHICHWLTFEAMSGFHVTITQVLRCETNDNWRRFILNKGTKLIQQCPKMAHTFKITFNSLEKFNENFENLRNCKESHDRLNITFAKNILPTEPTKKSDIKDINIERSASLI